MTGRRVRLGLAAVACLAVAVLLVLLAFDARGWQRTLTGDDLRFRALPDRPHLWRSPALLPGDPAAALLGTEDAIAYRRALQSFRRSRIGARSRPGLPVLRAQAQSRLEPVAAGARTAEERSNAANLLGVLTVTTPSSDTATQTQTLARAAQYFRRAIADDPADDAAKLNLELVLRLQKPGESRFDRRARTGFGFAKGRGPGAVGSGF